MLAVLASNEPTRPPAPCRRYGLIGPNGCGKSCLLKSLGARDLPIPEHIDVYLLDREIPASDMTALEVMPTTRPPAPARAARPAPAPACSALLAVAQPLRRSLASAGCIPALPMICSRDCCLRSGHKCPSVVLTPPYVTPACPPLCRR